MAVLLVFSSLPGLRGSELELSTSLEVLRGLPIRQFFDASYRLILLRDPENVTSAGLADEFGVRNDYLTDVSPEYILETYTLYRDVLDLLHAYDRDALSDADRLSYDIYEWYLDDWVRGEPYAFHQYPVISLGLSGWSTDVTVVTLFTTDQPLSTRGDLEGYIARLSRVSAKMEQLVAALRYREERGIVIPRFMVEGVIERLKSYLGIPGETPASPAAIAVEDTVLWPSFNERLGLVGGLSAQEKRDSLAAVRQGIAESFIPGFYALLRHMEDSLPQAPEIGGATVLPDGEAFYVYRLRDQTTLEITPDEVRALGLAEVARIQAEMRQEYEALGLSLYRGLFDLRQTARAGGLGFDLTVPEGQAAYLAENQRAVDLATAAMTTVCDLAPSNPLRIEPAPAGSGWCFYAPGSLDGSRPGVYYVNLDGGYADQSSTPVVAFHEAVPGHYFQGTIAQERDVPLFRRIETTQAYVEGWGLYSERLAAELGLYATPLEDLARLDLELIRACRLVIDADVHHRGRSAEEAAAYYESARGCWPGSQLSSMDRYVALPGQGGSATLGMLKLLELRQRMEDELGSEFSLREFHDLVLGNGPMPLPILERVVDEHIAQHLAE